MCQEKTDSYNIPHDILPAFSYMDIVIKNKRKIIITNPVVSIMATRNFS